MEHSFLGRQQKHYRIVFAAVRGIVNMKKPINNRKKAIIVKKNTAHRYCAIFALILYIAVMLFMIIGYRLTMIGVVGLFPGLVILVLLA